MSQSPLPESLVSDVPASLRGPVDIYWQRWCDACEQAQQPPTVAIGLDMTQLGYAWACSDYVARTCIHYPSVLHELAAAGLHEGMSAADYRAALDSVLDGEKDADNAAMRRHLRRFRHRHTLRIALRDLLRLADIDTLLQEQSDLAISIIDKLAVHLHKDYCATLGVPRDEHGAEQQLVILGMGKLGGGELNFSSDIDLIFCYAADGKTDGRGALSNNEFFVRLIREFVPMLDDVTADGFAYRVDIRLRPYGNSGPLAMSFNALENYYQSQGRAWERYAMIKAKPISGRADDIEALAGILRPFVFRRYLDYSVFAGIREMKGMIEEQVRRKSMLGNVKLGQGGIREIEFIGQTFQLIRGGRDNRLQVGSIMAILQLLPELGVLHRQESDHLLAAYRFLRELENRIQIEGDQQRHSLPTDDTARTKLLLAMRCGGWDELMEQVEKHTGFVQEMFAHLIEEQPQEDGASELEAAIKHYFTDAGADVVDGERLLAAFLAQGITISEEELEVLDNFRSSGAYRNTADSSRALCIRLVNLLLAEIEDHHASHTLKRLTDIMLAVIGRPVYLSMMLQYPLVRQRLIWLCQSGEWFTDQLRRMPILLDELLESDIEHSLPTRGQLESELASRLNAISAADFELVLDSLRVFKQSNVFKVAMLDIVASHAVTDLADRLSDIAELLIGTALDLAWREIAVRSGEPRCIVDGETMTPGIAVIAYGKLGGAELGYGSDLDVVFIHNSRGEKQFTDGERQLDNSAFFAKVIQRFLHILSTRTFSGVLYEIDTRLRPDGRAGLMVSSLDAFDHYQRERAWTWEHQALIRARFIAGDPIAAAEFARIRGSVLAQHRDWDSLARDVVAMRNKMRGHLASGEEGLDLKQDAGGLVDIEFIAQAGVLLLAVENPALLQTTATLRLLAELGDAGWLSPDDVAVLTGAYATLRRAGNYRVLGMVDEPLQQQCGRVMPAVSEIWRRLFAEFEHDKTG